MQQPNKREYIFIFLIQRNGKAIPHSNRFEDYLDGPNPKFVSTPNEGAPSLAISFQQEAPASAGETIAR